MYLQNLTKKYRLYAACGDFPFIQLLNSRLYNGVKILAVRRNQVNSLVSLCMMIVLGG